MMKKSILILILTLIFFSQEACPQDLYQVTVVAGDLDRQDCPVFISLAQPDYDNDTVTWYLYEKTGKRNRPVACQRENNGIWFILNGITPKHTRRTYILKKEKNNRQEAQMLVRKTFDSYVLKKGPKQILSFRYRTKAPPKGVDPLYQKSGYIHPLLTPSGDTLTRIQPPDHRHHYGIWGPWTKTHLDGREVDFWNLGKGEGTVKFAGLLSLSEGSVYCDLKVHQEHIDFGTKGADRVALNEVLEIRAWNIGKKAWLVDYSSTQSCPLFDGIFLDAYRYGGGLGYRATGKWTNKNSSVLTSEGKTRKDADGTRARWCRIEGNLDHGKCGILFMDHPGNRDFPEPMRVWPVNANKGRGDLFFEFCPIRLNNWKMERGKTYPLKYRMFIFNGEISPEQAERLWNGFARPPEIKVKKITEK